MTTPKKSNNHLTLLQLEQISQILSEAKPMPDEWIGPLQHILQCQQCFMEVQESIQDLQAIKESAMILQQQEINKPKPFEFIVEQMNRGFELVKANIKELMTTPMPLYHSIGSMGSIGGIHFILFFQNHPIKVSIETDSLTKFKMNFLGMPATIRKISIKREQNNEEKLVYEFGVRQFEHIAHLSKEQVYNNQMDQQTTILLYANDIFLGQIILNPKIEILD